MSRLRLALVCIPLLLVAGVGVAQGYQPNFIRNLLSPIITGGMTVTGASTFNGDLTVNGDAGVTKNTVLAGTTVFGSNIYPDGGSKYCYNGTGACTAYVAGDTFGGVTGAFGGGANYTGNWSTTGNVGGDYIQPASGLRNTATGAACSGNTGAVCVNDTGGFAVADGSGATNATISAAGGGVFTTLSVGAAAVLVSADWSNSASTFAVPGAALIQEFGATGAASTITAVNWTPLIVGVGTNFVMKYCGDSACAGTTYATCTTTCAATVGTPLACTINVAAMAKAVDPFLKITTACGTTNPQGGFVAHHTQP